MRPLILMSLLLCTLSSARAQEPVSGVLREPGKPPVKAERAVETWSLALTKAQPQEVIKDLQNRLVADQEREVRLSAAWALGHLLSKETGEEAHAYDDPPRMTWQTRPVYPSDAYRQRIQGTVVVEFVIDERGQVAHAEVRESISPLDRAALATVKQWRFSPAHLAGKPVAAMAKAPVSFRITK